MSEVEVALNFLSVADSAGAVEYTDKISILIIRVKFFFEIYFILNGWVIIFSGQGKELYIWLNLQIVSFLIRKDVLMIGSLKFKTENLRIEYYFLFLVC